MKIIKLGKLNIKHHQNILEFYKEFIQKILEKEYNGKKLYEYYEKPNLKPEDIIKFEFEVEELPDGSKICIRYPGRKVRDRETNRSVYKWANLLDFVVVIYDKNGNEEDISKYTFKNFLEDFDKYKRKNETFWKCLEKIYYENYLDINLAKKIKCEGMDPIKYLLILKWIWIQEDLNYKYSYEDFKDIENLPKYILLNKNGNRTQKGAGRTKFFAALLLNKYDNKEFNVKIIQKVVRLF